MSNQREEAGYTSVQAEQAEEAGTQLKCLSMVVLQGTNEAVLKEKLSSSSPSWRPILTLLLF